MQLPMEYYRNAMKIKKDYYSEFEKLFHSVSDLMSDDYSSFLQLHPSLDYLLKLAPTCVFIIDYRTMDYLFYSETIKDMVGYGREEFMKGGIKFLFSHVHPDDLEVLTTQILPYITSFLKSVPPESYKDYKFSFNYRFKRIDGKYEHFRQYSTYLEPDSTGRPTINFGIAINFSPLKKDNRIALLIEKREGDEFRRISVNSDITETIFSKRELEILKLIHGGLSSSEIAKKLYLSDHTVNNHRKNMLKKTATTNTASLISYAIANGYL